MSDTFVFPESVEVAARADAAFAGMDFDALGRADKRRFLERAEFILQTVTDANMLGTEAWQARMAERLERRRKHP